MPTGLYTWTTDPHARVYPDAPPGSGSEVTFTAGRNEVASGQITVRSPRPLDGLRVEVGELIGRESGASLPAGCLTWRAAGHVLAPETGRLTPDPLLPWEVLDLSADFSQPLWLTLHTPPDAEPGVYTGTVTLRAGRQEVGRIGVRAELLDLNMPDGRDLSFHLNLWQHPSTLAYYHAVPPWSERHWEITRAYLREMATRGQKVAVATVVDGPWRYTDNSMQQTMVRWIRRVDGSFAFEFDRFDRYVEMAMEEGIDGQVHAYSMRQFLREDGVTVTYYNEESGEDVEEYLLIGSERYRELWTAFLAAFSRHLEARGWLERTYLGIDEMKNAAAFRGLIDLVHRVEPRLRITAAFNDLDTARALADSVAQFCLYLDHVDPAFVQERQEAGDEVTWYTCCIPPAPNTFIHSPPIESRLLPWMTWQQGLDGYLRWAFAFWPPRPDGSYDPFHYLRWDFERPWGDWPWPSGDMFLVYPGDDGRPLSSVRWELLREGIQDYEYLARLRQKAIEGNPASGGELRQALEQAVALVTQGFDRYTTRGADVRRARQLVTRALLAAR